MSLKMNINTKSFLLLAALLTSALGESYKINGKDYNLILDGTTKKTASGEVIFYRDEKNKLLGVSQKIIVKFKNNEDKSAIYNDFQLQEIQVLLDNMVVVNAPSSHVTLDICQKLQERSEIEFAHPDFLYQKEQRSLEPLYNELWHLENKGQFGGIVGADINATGAWKITKGNDVKIAIMDGGFDTNHEDLKDAIIAQRDFDYDDYNATYQNTYEYHGTLCSGIAIARENGKGTVGVAPKASLIAIKIGGKDENDETLMVFDSQFISAFLWARDQGADVISCSWGTYNVSDGLKSVIDDVALKGRNGKGIPIFFAAGNDASGQTAWENDEAALESVIAVGSSTDRNEKAWYSNYGSKLDIVAPSGDGYIGGFGITTTDLSGNLGYVSNASTHPNYALTSDFTGFHGTSASTPMVAAAAALMLSINPELTKDQVKNIIEGTADKIGSIQYINGRNNYFGYGKLNAGSATKMAQSASTFFQNMGIKSGIWNLLSLSSNQSIYDIKGTFGDKTWRIYAWNNQKSIWKIWASDRTCAEIQSAGAECLESINSKEGFFIANYGSMGDNNISLQGGKIYEDFPQVTKGWNLLGLGAEVNLTQLKQQYGDLIIVWKMVDGNYIKITKNTDTIKPGEGFWIYLPAIS